MSGAFDQLMYRQISWAHTYNAYQRLAGGEAGPPALARLLEAPAGAAAHRSNMLSADNDDGTAADVWRPYAHSGLPREWGLHWNAVPWHLGVRGKIAAATKQDIEQGREWLLRPVDLLPDLVVLVCLGNAARDAVAPAMPELSSRGVQVLSAPPPSQRRYNVSEGADELKVLAAFAEASRLAGVSKR